MDAVVRFNNTDPEYRVEIKPLIYSTEAERDRLLIDLATSGSGVDLLDTSLLPAGAVDAGMFVDLLPYIDADESIGREDFIPGVLDAMTRGGGLYEYIDKVALLTMYTSPGFAAGDWTVEHIQELIAGHPELALPAGQERLVTMFSLAATAEFMDWTDMSCHFDSPEFIAWLTLLKALPMEGDEWSRDPFLFWVDHDFTASVGYRTRERLNDEYVTVGFPGAQGSGSYFMKLGQYGAHRSGHLPGDLTTGGYNTSLGIMASGENRDGAWRFMRTFMRGEAQPSLYSGIPVLRDCFERAVDFELRQQQSTDNRGFAFEFFNERDAEALRELVYGTQAMACSDGVVLDAMRTAINAYLGGQGSAEDAARQIQSRLSLYMGEQA